MTEINSNLNTEYKEIIKVVSVRDMTPEETKRLTYIEEKMTENMRSHALACIDEYNKLLCRLDELNEEDTQWFNILGKMYDESMKYVNKT
jgi:hypothetical protein